ncbi:MAG: TRAP transporter large permease [Desulfobacterales bacterium]|nr:MAG: TRAP transporter large permease [Desulfobacterales bacterium]
MSPDTAAILGLIFLFMLMALRMPVSFAMILAGFLGNAWIISTDAAIYMLATNVWGQLSSYGLSVIPLFVLMGQLAFHSGITERLYNAAYKWVGRLPGGLAGTTILSSAGFAAICGSNSATSATMGTIALPEMKRYEYDAALSTGSVAIGGTLGVVIPPSVVLIIIAVQTEQSITRLFIASIVPGVILTLLFLVTVFWRCLRNPHLGPPGPRAAMREKLLSLSGAAEAMMLFALVIGGLYAGWFTPTEAGAAGSFGALLIGLARRKLSKPDFFRAVAETIRISAMVVLLITGAVIFGRFLTVTRLPFELADWAVSLHVPREVILFVVLVIYLVGGCLMDALGFLVVTIPIFFPLAQALGFDPVWYTVVITLVTTMGAVTPPVGVNVYIVSALSPDVPIATIFRGVSIFLVAYVICLVLLMLFPEMALYLPRSLM